MTEDSVYSIITRRGFNGNVEIGIPLYYHWRFDCLSHITDDQAKRKKTKEMAYEETIQRHAGQIFCEMLGQACQKELYQDPATEYQEVIRSQRILTSGVCDFLSTHDSIDLLFQTPECISRRNRQTWDKFLKKQQQSCRV